MPIAYPSRPAVLAGEQHEEWLLDDAIDDTFPASDPIALGQPGSIVNERYAALERRQPRRMSNASNRLLTWSLLGAALACALVAVRRRRRARVTSMTA